MVHPRSTRFNCLNIHITGHFHGPKVWVKTPFVMSFVSGTNRWKGFDSPGSSRLEPKSELLLKPQMPVVYSLSLAWGSVPLLVLLYRGLALSVNSGIQRQYLRTYSSHTQERLNLSQSLKLGSEGWQQSSSETGSAQFALADSQEREPAMYKVGLS